MYESLKHIDKRIIFRETFNSEQETRRNGGVPTDVDYSNGVGSFNGDSTIIQYPVIQIPTSCSIRVKVKANSTIDANKRGLMGKFFNTDGEGFNSIAFDGEAFSFYATNGNNRTFTGYSKETWYEVVFVIEDSIQKLYANGVLNNATYTDRILVNYNLNCIGDIDSDGGTSRPFDGDIDLIEIYEGVLTQEEVKNLYENKTYQELPDKIEEQLGDQLVVPNGGADNTTDWVDSDEDGLADDWFTLLSPITSIVSGNGFTGNAQRIEASGAITAVLGISSIAAEVGKQYKISFKYRTNSNNFIIFWSNDLIIAEPELNEGDAIYYEAISTCIDPSIRFYSNNNGEGKWIEVDEVKIEEVKNTDCEKILDVSAQQGVLEDKMGNELTPTDIDIKKIGNVYTPIFNGSTSKIDCGDFDDLTGDITVMAWINPTDITGTDTIVENGRLQFWVYDLNNTLLLRSDGSTSKVSANNSIDINKIQFVVATRTSNGIVNFYIGDLDTAPSLSGTANQDSGTPAPGTNNIMIGDNGTGARVFKGKIPSLEIYSGLCSLEQITQYWSNTKKYYK